MDDLHQNSEQTAGYENNPETADPYTAGNSLFGDIIEENTQGSAVMSTAKPDPVMQQKRDIRFTALTVCIPFFCVFLFSRIWVYPIYLIGQMFGFSPDQIQSTLTEPAVQEICQILLSMLLFLLPFSIVARTSGRISDLVPLGKPEKGNVLPFFLLGLGFCSFANIASYYMEALFPDFSQNYYVNYGRDPRGIFGFVISLLATAVVPPLVEEYACRGVAFGMLRKHGDGFAIVGSALLFGCMHGNFDQIPFAFLVGLVLGYIRAKTGTLWVCCLVHAGNNLISVLYDYLQRILPSALRQGIFILLPAVSMLAALAALLWIGRREQTFTLENPSGAMTERQKFGAFFSSPFIIAFLVLTAMESLQYFDWEGLFS